jgi:short-subunit dehydrogenase
MELQPDGIAVTTICPGYVKTAFQSHIIGGTVPQKVASSRAFTITADECAEAIARGVERGSRTVLTPRIGWALVWFARLFPRLADARLGSMLR